MFTLDEAFESILDAVRHALVDVQDAGATAFRHLHFEKAQTLLDRACQLKSLETQINALEHELDSVTARGEH